MSTPNIGKGIIRMTMQIKLILASILLCLSCLSGIYIGYKMFDNKPEVVVQHSAGEVVVNPNTKILAKQPDKDAKADMPLPKGATLERMIKFSVRQKAKQTQEGDSSQSTESRNVEGKVGGVSGETSLDELCPPIDISLALILDKDQQQRVEAYSPNGDIVGGIDIPVRDITIPKEAKKWAVGMSYNTLEVKGLWVERDVGRIRLGAEVVSLPVVGEVYTARVGFTF